MLSAFAAHYADGGALRTQLQHQRNKFQEIVIDAGGRDSTALRTALVLSDLVLVPFQPRSIDVWAVADIAALIEEARAMRDGLQALVVLNTPIRRRKSIANAAGNGMSVFEQRPRDEKAIAELNALLKAIY